MFHLGLLENNAVRHSHLCFPLKLLVQSLDHWPIFLTAVLYILGFFQTQCGRSTSQFRLRALA